MKILLSYLAVMSVGLISVYTDAKAQERQDIEISHFSSLPLRNADLSEMPEAPIASLRTVISSGIQKTTSPLYLANLSEAIDQSIFAFNQQNQTLVFPAVKSLKLSALRRLLNENTNSQGVQLYPTLLCLFSGGNIFSPNVKTLRKLPYETKGNWGVSPPSGG